MSSAVDNLYVEEILYHYWHSPHRGRLAAPDAVAEDANPLCGDRLRVELALRDGCVATMMFGGQGCAVSQAAASMLAELVEGRTIEAARTLDRAELLGALGVALTPSRLKCALLPLTVLRQALAGSREPSPR